MGGGGLAGKADLRRPRTLGAGNGFAAGLYCSVAVHVWLAGHQPSMSMRWVAAPRRAFSQRLIRCATIALGLPFSNRQLPVGPKKACEVVSLWEG